MKNILRFLVLCVMVMCALSVTVYLQTQGKERVLKKPKSFNPPVEIVNFKSKIGEIKSDKKFITEDEDWLKGLTIKIRNNSKKPITFISYQLRIPNSNKNLPSFVFFLTYGINPIFNKQGKFFYKRANSIVPHGNIDIEIGDENYHNIRKSLREKYNIASINQATIVCDLIEFEDETLWLGGKYYRLDESDPRKLIPQNLNVILNNESNFFFSTNSIRFLSIFQKHNRK
jgi:hypothetical protein